LPGKVNRSFAAASDYHHLPFPLIASRVLQGLEQIAGLNPDEAANTVAVKTYKAPLVTETAHKPAAGC
jgi:hypothetical protein